MSACIFGQEISIKNVKDENAQSARFNFDIVNNADSAWKYTVALERWDEGSGWNEVKSDVFNYTPTKKSRLWTIQPHTTSNHFFYPSRWFRATSKVDESIKFRLQIRYGVDVSNRDHFSYSQPFHWKNK
ncbi:MAG: hypothetical protein DI539_23995 [Flavobacterium psychrophilum]|nr:MAG: hypothetical protein DI539_23995 [Flavobacterium psychrophilum]